MSWIVPGSPAAPPAPADDRAAKRIEAIERLARNFRCDKNDRAHSSTAGIVPPILGRQNAFIDEGQAVIYCKVCKAPCEVTVYW